MNQNFHQTPGFGTPTMVRQSWFYFAMRAAGLAAIGLGTVAGATLCAEIKIEDVPGQQTFTFEFAEVTDFSGLTWVKDGLFYTVGNRTKAFMPLEIGIEPATGKILSAKIGARVPVKTPLDDFEGIAYVPEKDRFYISTERPPGIVGFDRGGDATYPVTLPDVYAQARFNKGLEALAYGAGTLWTGNEDALTVDGPLSSAGSGAWVRLQKFDKKFRPTLQYGYRTDSSLLRISGGGTGLVDLVVLPDGRLLSLERVVALGLQAKIFAVDFEGATDTRELGSLAKAEFTAVKKELLFNRSTGTINFEGIAVGPDLADGWRSLILIADSAQGTKHTLMPLRIHLDPEPKEEKKPAKSDGEAAKKRKQQE